LIAEVDPIAPLQAAMEGYRWCGSKEVVAMSDIFVTARGNFAGDRPFEATCCA